MSQGLIHFICNASFPRNKIQVDPQTWGIRVCQNSQHNSDFLFWIPKSRQNLIETLDFNVSHFLAVTLQQQEPAFYLHQLAVYTLSTDYRKTLLQTSKTALCHPKQRWSF